MKKDLLLHDLDDIHLQSSFLELTSCDAADGASDNLVAKLVSREGNINFPISEENC